MTRPIIFIINDYFKHGGHVRSFTEQLKCIENDIIDFKIICDKEGYINKNLNYFKNIKNENLITVDMSNLRKLKFSYSLFKEIKNALNNNYILHIYSDECYFSALLSKLYFNNISIIHSVMGGPNPFPSLNSTDLYIAVSEEQAKEVDIYNLGNVKIIKNRIKNKLEIEKLSSNLKNSILIVTRFDIDKKASLDKIFRIISNLSNFKILIAGEGHLLEEYKNMYSLNKNIQFLGFCNNLEKYREESFVVLGMGRSILESLINGNKAILIGHEGIELMENIENVKFASVYNFAGRKILNPISEEIIVSKIKQYSDEYTPLKKEIIDFLNIEYSINYFSKKYFNILQSLTPKRNSFFQLLNEFCYIQRIRIKRKIVKWRKF